MANTTNFGWETPDDTDLVKDGASAMRTLGNAIDTSLVDLKGGTTGQVLSKASNTDMDFTWNSVDPLTILDAKGDLISATAADTPARLAVGADGTYLQADSTTSTGLKWASVSAGGMTSLASGSIAASATGFDLTSISGSYNELWLYIRNYSTSTSADIQIRTNGNTAGDYSYQYYKTTNGIWAYTQGDNRFMLADGINSTQSGFSAFVRFPDYKNTTGYKQVFWQAAKADNDLWSAWGFTRSTSAISRITFSTTAGTFDSGTYELFGVK